MRKMVTIHAISKNKQPKNTKHTMKPNTKGADLLEKKLLTKLFAQFTDARNVLEVGCGTGHFTRWMESTLGLECYGIDTSKAMLKEAKKRWPGGALLQSDGANCRSKTNQLILLFL